MPAEPRFAVIIGVYGRKEFVLNAVRSVEAQTIPRDRFEVIVSTNYADPQIDRALEAAGVTIFRDEESLIGRKQARALAVSTAPWVTFLDDDDAFEPERFERLSAVLAAHPDVGYYRNRVRVVDRQGAALPLERWRLHEVDRGFDELGEVYVPAEERQRAYEVGVRRTFATFNSSSMTLRRELLDGEFGEVFRRSYLADTLLFLAAALQPVGLFLDDRRLTRYRHAGWSMMSDPRWYERAVTSEADLADLAARHGRSDFATYFRRLSVHYRRMQLGNGIVGEIAAGGARRSVARRAGEYLRYLAEHPDERQMTIDTWAAGLYGLGYALLPSAVRRLAGARLTAGRP